MQVRSLVSIQSSTLTAQSHQALTTIQQMAAALHNDQCKAWLCAQGWCDDAHIWQLQWLFSPLTSQRPFAFQTNVSWIFQYSGCSYIHHIYLLSSDSKSTSRSNLAGNMLTLPTLESHECVEVLVYSNSPPPSQILFFQRKYDITLNAERGTRNQLLISRFVKFCIYKVISCFRGTWVRPAFEHSVCQSYHFPSSPALLLLPTGLFCLTFIFSYSLLPSPISLASFCFLTTVSCPCIFNVTALHVTQGEGEGGPFAENLSTGAVKVNPIGSRKCANF